MQKTYLTWGLLFWLAYFGPVENTPAQPVTDTESCYETLLLTGNRHFQRQQYARAVGQYRTALASCTDVPEDHPLDSLIAVAYQAEVELLNASKRRITVLAAEIQYHAQQEAEARKAAEAARRDAADNAVLAGQNERRAIEEGRRAATLRYSALAELELEEGSRENALLLSLLALRYSDSLSYATAMQAYAQVVADSFTQGTDYWEGIREFRLTESYVDVLTNGKIERIALAPGAAAIPGPPAGDEILTATDSDLLLRRGDGYLWWSDGQPAEQTLPGSASIRAAHVLRSGAELIAVGTDSSILHWQAGASPTVLTHSAAGRNYAIEPLAELEGTFAVRTSAGVVEVWRTGDQQPWRTLAAGGAYVYDCLAKNRSIALGTATGKVLLFGADAAEPVVLEHGDRAVVQLQDLAGDPALFLSRADDEVLNVWDLSGSLQAVLPADATILGVRDWPEARRIIAWTAAGSVWVWSYAGERLQQYRGFASRLLDVDYVPGEACLLATEASGALTLLEGEERVGEWAVSAAAGTLPRYAPATEQVVMVAPSGDRLQRIPLPQSHYRSLNRAFTPSAIPRSLIEKYNIDFWDE